MLVVPELNHLDREGGFLKEGERYERQIQRGFRRAEFGAGRVLQNSFVLVSAGVKTENGCELEKSFYCLY